MITRRPQFANIKRLAFSGLLLLIAAAVQGQILGNPSLEGATNVLPPLPWVVCGGTPDNQILNGSGQGIYAINTPAQDGISYVGMVTAYFGYIEAIGQPVSLTSGTSYTGSIALYRSTLHPQWDGTGQLQIWGGSGCNNLSELLWSSGTINNLNTWQNYPISFAPLQNHTWIAFVNYFNPGSGTMDYFCMDDIQLNAVVLPLEISAFTASDGEAGVDLSWETAALTSEFDFEVEWSENALDFQRVGEVEGKLGATSFQLRHGSPRPGPNYYRLRMLDVNGEETFSEIRQVEHQENHLLSLFPNPSNGKVTLSVRLYGTTQVEVNARDVAGRLLFREAKELPAGLQSMPLKQTRNLAPGLYQLEIRLGDEVTYQSITVQK